MLLQRYPGLQVQEGRATHVEDDVVVEERFQLYLNDRLLTELVASPDQLEELGAGFVTTEGVADHVDLVQVSGNRVSVHAETSGASSWVLRSGGAVGSGGKPKTVHSSLVLAQHDVFDVIRQTQSEIWKKTGAVHCSVLLMDGKMVVRSSDVGRHNTIDKVVGFAILHGIDLARCVVGCTGRQPAGMVNKVANAGIPVIVSKAAPTNRGILVAQEAGVTLVCFARESRFTVYSHPYRIEGLAGAQWP